MRYALPLLLTLSLAACDSSTPADAGTPDAATDTSLDTAVDTSPDVAPDTAVDISPDTSPDVASDTASDGPPTVCSLAAVYTFGLDGGLVASRDIARIEPPRRFTLTRMDFRIADAGTLSCSTVLNDCGPNDGGTVDTQVLLDAFANADVVAAFADTTNTLYGRDPRPVDGQVFMITRGDGRHVEIGPDCGGVTGCRAITPGLARLRAVLETLQTMQLAQPECASLRR